MCLFKFIDVYISYDRINGKLFWKKSPITSNRLLGKECGKLTSNGYRRITIKGKGYLIHRLIWLIETGYWPKNKIDHIDGNKLNNYIFNLRDVTNRENQLNQKIHRNGRLQGCSFHKKKQKWLAKIEINNRAHFLGGFKTEIEAHNAYLKALKKILTY